MMTSLPVIRYLPETPVYDDAIAALADEAFGPGRYAKAAERVRETASHDRSLSAVALFEGHLVGSVRQSRVDLGGRKVLLLGPLAVSPPFKGQGIGRALMGEAERLAREAGEPMIVLVGDPAYYRPLGYRPLPAGFVRFPRPVDPARVLGLDLSASD